MSTFLPSAALFELTGRKHKTKQIEALRRMGLPFWINALGKPVVSCAVIEGRKEAAKPKKWTPPT